MFRILYVQYVLPSFFYSKYIKKIRLDFLDINSILRAMLFTQEKGATKMPKTGYFTKLN